MSQKSAPPISASAGATTIDPSVMKAMLRKRAREKHRSRLRWFFVMAIPTLIVAMIAVTLSRPPRFYVERMRAADPTEQKALSSVVLKKGTTLINDIENGRPWAIALEETQLNSWLAEDFQNNFAEHSLPSSVQHPRIDVEGEILKIGFRYRWAIVDTVITIGIRAWVPKSNVLVIELQGATAGSLPLPTNYVRHVIEQFCYSNNISVSWRRNNGRLAGLLEFPSSSRQLVLTQVTIDKNGILIGGASGRSQSKLDFAPSAN